MNEAAKPTVLVLCAGDFYRSPMAEMKSDLANAGFFARLRAAVGAAVVAVPDQPPTLLAKYAPSASAAK